MTKANIFFKQCFLERKTGTRPEVVTQQIAWIPEVFAHKGQFVEIKGENGWEVTAVSQVRMEHNEMMERSQDFKHQSQASDVRSIPTKIRTI